KAAQGAVWPRRALSGAALIAAGAVFPAHAQVTETVLHAFSGGRDGDSPYARVVLDRKGTLYGTTGYGGAVTGSGCLRQVPGCGNVFEFSPPTGGGTAWTERVLGDFQGPDRTGDLPLGEPLILDTPVSLKGIYGTASGLEGGHGTVFRLSAGRLT